MVRTALALGDRELAERLAAGVEPPLPYADHAGVAVNAALAEARGDLQAAADGYADAADRWQRFGVVPEQAFALLGQGRCLIALGRTVRATPVLQQAREIFAGLKAAPALVETDTLLQRGRSTQRVRRLRRPVRELPEGCAGRPDAATTPPRT